MFADEISCMSFFTNSLRSRGKKIIIDLEPIVIYTETAKSEEKVDRLVSGVCEVFAKRIAGVKWSEIKGNVY